MTTKEQMKLATDSLYSRIKSSNLSDWVDELQDTISFFLDGAVLDRFKERLDAVTRAREDAAADSGEPFSKEDKDRMARLYSLLNQLKSRSGDYRIQRLLGQGYSLGKNPLFQEAMKKQRLDILEDARAGRRDRVLYRLLRIFDSSGQKFPWDLALLGKQEFDDEEYRNCIYAFLSGIAAESTEKRRLLNE